MRFSNPFRSPTADEVAIKQLAAAGTELLAAQEANEYYRHRVAMLTERVDRLQARNSTIQHGTAQRLKVAA